MISEVDASFGHLIEFTTNFGPSYGLWHRALGS